jgi:hypothetical protein
MAKSVADKLLIKTDAAVWCSDRARLGLIEPLPEGARRVTRLDRATVGIVFAEDERSLRRSVRDHAAGLRDLGVLWVAYPKGNRADINRDSVWPILAEHGLRPIAQVALDEVWSALRFRPLQEGEAPFTGGR